MGLASSALAFFSDPPMPSLNALANEKFLADAVSRPAPTPSAKLAEFRSDIAFQNLIPIGVEFLNSDLVANFKRARYRDPRYLYDMMTELMRLGPGPQITKATEAMKSATAQFQTSPVSWDDANGTPTTMAQVADGTWQMVAADPGEVQIARICRDYLGETLTPHLSDLIGINGAGEHWYGVACSKIRLNPRGNMGRWDSIDAIEEIPQRRFRLSPTTDEWMLMLSPFSWEGYPVKDLLLNPAYGNEGLFFTEIGANSQHLDQRGLLAQLLWLWNAEHAVWRWRGKYVQDRGNPPMWATINASRPDRQQQMLDELGEIGNAGKGVIVDGEKIDFAPSISGDSDPFAAMISDIHRQYDAVLLAHEQGSGVQKGVGGKTQGDEARQQFEDVTNSRLRTFSPQLVNGLGRVLITRAFGADIAARHTPMISLRFQDRDDPTALASNALVLKQSGAGKFVAAKKLVQRCGFDVAGPGDVTLGDAPGVAPMEGAIAQALAVAEKSGELPKGFGKTVIEHYRGLVGSLQGTHDMQALVSRLASAPKPDIQRDADLMAAATVRAVLEAKQKAREQMRSRNVAPMRRKA